MVENSLSRTWFDLLMRHTSRFKSLLGQMYLLEIITAAVPLGVLGVLEVLVRCRVKVNGILTRVGTDIGVKIPMATTLL